MSNNIPHIGRHSIFLKLSCYYSVTTLVQKDLTRKFIHPQKTKDDQQLQQQQNLPGTASPLTIKFGVHELAVNNPESKESKVGKAAQYWNNYIGEVISKSKPVHPDSVKSLVGF